MHKHSGEGVGLTPPRSLATIRVVLGGEGPETARNRSICWSLGIPQGRRFGGSPRAPRSSLGVPGTRGTDLLRGARSPDFGTPQLPRGYLQNRGFWQNPHIKPLHLYGTPIYPQNRDSGVPAARGGVLRGVPNWRIIKYRPGGAPPDGPQGPRWGP